MGAGIVSGLLVTSLFAAPPRHAAAATQVHVRLSEWKVELSEGTIGTGPVTFVITNAGTIPHGLEVEGAGIEKEVESIQPGATDTLTLRLTPGTYDVYCPVGSDSHRKLGMDTHLRVASGRLSGAAGPTTPDAAASQAPRAKVQAMHVVS